jgi:RimJ/RimL family protein N-acetyltransferase
VLPGIDSGEDAVMIFDPVQLCGPRVRLDPLSVDHASGLLAAADDDQVFEWLAYDRPTTIEQMHRWVQRALDQVPHRLPFVVITGGQIAGTTSYWYPNPITQQVHIDSAWLGRAWWGKQINTELKYLMLAHAFDDRGCAKVVLRTNPHNLRSQRAMEKHGAHRDGLLRRDLRLPDGTWRDSVYYSFLREEWPAVDNLLQSQFSTQNGTARCPDREIRRQGLPAMTGFCFPLKDMNWLAYQNDPDLQGEDDGEPGRGGWGVWRSRTHRHLGIDLRITIGHEVVAVEDGLAEYRSATVNAGSGAWNTAGHRVRLTGVSGAGYQYFHLGTSNACTADAFPAGVHCGDVVPVKTGQILGFAGYTGGSVATGRAIPPQAAHLHFQYHPGGIDGADANPIRLFEQIFTHHNGQLNHRC